MSLATLRAPATGQLLRRDRGPDDPIRSATPNRLRALRRVLMVGFLLLGAVGVSGGIGNHAAVDDAGSRLTELSALTSQLYQSLADADTGATTGYVFGGTEPTDVRERFDDDITRVGSAVARIAALQPAAEDVDRVALISEQVPVYTSLVEAARSYNRLGLAIGQSHLTTASALMRETILPAAEELRKSQARALDDALHRAARGSLGVVLIGLALLLAIIDLSIHEYRRTNRVISYSIATAGTCVGVVLLGIGSAWPVAHSELDSARRTSDATALLEDIRAVVLQARSAENLTLIAGNAGVGEADFDDRIALVIGPEETSASGVELGRSGLLESIRPLSVVSSGRLDTIADATEEWAAAHDRMRDTAASGDYVGAVGQTLGDDSHSTGELFDRLDGLLAETIESQRRELIDDVGTAGGVLVILPWLVGVATAVAAAATAVGFNRRIGDYR